MHARVLTWFSVSTFAPGSPWATMAAVLQGGARATPPVVWANDSYLISGIGALDLPGFAAYAQTEAAQYELDWDSSAAVPQQVWHGDLDRTSLFQARPGGRMSRKYAAFLDARTAVCPRRWRTT
jgi:hypothetical protein